MKNLQSVSIMFPVYKDKRTVKKMIVDSLNVVKKITKKYEIIIIDDGCPEKSGLIAKKFSKKNKKIRVIFHKKNLGYGAAIQTGLKYSKNQWIFQTDGDAEYDVYDLLRLIKLTNTSDLIITYRYKKKYNTNRIIISWFYNAILKFYF